MVSAKMVAGKMDAELSDLPRHLPPGAIYLPAFISSAEEIVCVALLDAQTWNTELKRRVQHFGYRYDYKARAVRSDSYLGALPDWLRPLAERLVASGCFTELPDQVIANEYLPGQGISAHVDCEPCFGDTIVSLSLLSRCEMIFREKRSGIRRALILEPRSAVVMSGEARYDWTHEIPARKSDVVDGVKLDRSRRISLTFRKVIRSL